MKWQILYVLTDPEYSEEKPYEIIIQASDKNLAFDLGCQEIQAMYGFDDFVIIDVIDTGD